MKASKLIVLVGGILGIIAFFLPMVSVTRENQTVKVSALQVVQGIDAVKGEISKTDVSAASMEDKTNLAKADTDLSSIKGIVLAIFAPALLLALIGGLGVMRKKFGRGAGTLSFLLGAVGLGIGAILKSAAEGDSGIALTLLLVTGAAGLVGGLMALIKPERAPATAMA